MKSCSSIPNDRDGRVDNSLEDTPFFLIILYKLLIFKLLTQKGSDAECLSECGYTVKDEERIEQIFTNLHNKARQ